MDATLLKMLDMVLDDVIEVLNENDWEDEAEWYDELRQGLHAHKPGSAQFNELLAELEQSFMGLGTFTDIPLASKLAEAGDVLGALDYHHQRLGLVSCASGIIREIKRSI